jgi:hypothetical protein
MKKMLYAIRREIHPFSILALIGLDLLWNIPELVAVGSGIGILGMPILSLIILIICALLVGLIQHYISCDAWIPSILKGIVFGIIAALPFSVISMIGSGIWKTFELIFGQTELKNIGKLVVDWRRIEKTIKKVAYDAKFFDWLDMKRAENPKTYLKNNSESWIVFLYETGIISFEEKKITDLLRMSRNTTFHDETPANLASIVNQAEALIKIFQVKPAFNKAIQLKG